MLIVQQIESVTTVSFIKQSSENKGTFTQFILAVRDGEYTAEGVKLHGEKLNKKSSLCIQ